MSSIIERRRHADPPNMREQAATIAVSCDTCPSTHGRACPGHGPRPPLRRARDVPCRPRPTHGLRFAGHRSTRRALPASSPTSAWPRSGTADRSAEVEAEIEAGRDIGRRRVDDWRRGVDVAGRIVVARRAPAVAITVTLLPLMLAPLVPPPLVLAPIVVAPAPVAPTVAAMAPIVGESRRRAQAGERRDDRAGQQQRAQRGEFPVIQAAHRALLSGSILTCRQRHERRGYSGRATALLTTRWTKARPRAEMGPAGGMRWRWFRLVRASPRSSAGWGSSTSPAAPPPMARC